MDNFPHFSKNSNYENLCYSYLKSHDLSRLVVSKELASLVINSIKSKGYRPLGNFFRKINTYSNFYLNNDNYLSNPVQHPNLNDYLENNNIGKLKRKNTDFYIFLYQYLVKGKIELTEKNTDFKSPFSLLTLNSKKISPNGMKTFHKLKYNFVGVDRKDPRYVTFVPYHEKYKVDWVLGNYTPEMDDSIRRVKLGKFLGYIGIDLFLLETIVTHYKFFWNIKYKKESFQFKVLTGEEIRKGYVSHNHYSHSTLSRSCMNDKVGFLDLYCKNPNVSLLVLEGQGKILGRALLWTDKSGKLYMDRVYYSKEFVHAMFINWATDQGIATYKKYRSAEYFKIKLMKTKKGGGYPYMDTFRYLNRLTGHLTNKEPNKFSKLFYLTLQNTQGGYSWSFLD